MPAIRTIPRRESAFLSELLAMYAGTFTLGVSPEADDGSVIEVWKQTSDATAAPYGVLHAVAVDDRFSYFKARAWDGATVDDAALDITFEEASMRTMPDALRAFRAAAGMPDLG